MNITAIKEKLTSLDLKLFTTLFKRIHTKNLLQGMVGVALFYGCIFGYVYMSSEKTLNNIKKKIPSHNVGLTFADHVVPETNITPSKPKKDKDITDLVIEGLYQKTAQGLIPIIRTSDNLTSFRAYQHPFPSEKITDKPIITIAVQNYGLSQKQSETILDILPPEASLMLSPYSELLNEWIKMAHHKGHEVWLELPIQNENNTGYGQYTVFHHVSLPEKIATLYRVLTKTQGYMGLASFTDEQIMATPEHYGQLMDEIYKRGLGFLETNPNAPERLRGKAISMGAPYIKADIKTVTITGDKSSLTELENIAKKQGHAIAIIPPYPTTIKNLAVWIEKIGKIDYTIAPVSVIYDLPFFQQDMMTNQAPSDLSEHDKIEPEQ